MQTYDICIIGGGASALMCASLTKNRKIVIVERDNKIGKKILVTGNGRCNLTNTYIDKQKYNTNLVSKYFEKFSSKETIEYFNKLGLITYHDDEGRVYPVSNSANSVLDVLRLSILNKNIDYKTNTTIKELYYTGDGFDILTLDEVFHAQKVVLALGGNPDLSFIKNIKLPVVNYKKSLGALKTDKNKFLNNVRANVNVTLDTRFCQKGEILFKEDGISGIVIFNLSSHLARSGNYNAKIFVDFLPDYSKKETKNLLIERRIKFSDYSASDYLTGIFHKAINDNLLYRASIKDKKIGLITNAEIDTLTNYIKTYPITTYDILDNNQVYSGGIPLKMLNDNMMFKSCPGLYAIGEIVDVDGECGGYNLQWAWTSAFLCAEDL